MGYERNFMIENYSKKFKIINNGNLEIHTDTVQDHHVFSLADRNVHIVFSTKLKTVL